jgi:hypothetical protein
MVRFLRSLAWASAAAFCWLLTNAAGAQTTGAPGSHWGASMYPALRPGNSGGFEILGFTHLGKDTRPDGAPLKPSECDAARAAGNLPPGAPCGVPDPYNYMDKTIGLNLLSVAITRPLKRYDSRGSNLLYTHNFVAGMVSDYLPELYQNRVIHKVAGLQPIRREGIACKGSSGKVYNCYSLGYGGELNYKVNVFDRTERIAIRETPFFAGSGFMVSNIESEVYTQLGLRRFDLTSGASPRVARWVSLSISTMVRAGVLVPGAIFERLASLYVIADATLAAHFFPYDWPVTVEFGYAANTGQFIDRPRATTADHREVQSGPVPVPLPERMYHLRVELGEFTFETYNDSPGGKDKGPSFGARIFYTVAPGTTEARLLYKAARCVRDFFRGNK